MIVVSSRAFRLRHCVFRLPLRCLLLVLGASTASASDGVLNGVVVNATQGGVVRGAEVLLRGQVGGEMMLLARDVTNDDGEFQFTGLPLRGIETFVPGANQDGVHFPGPRVRVSPESPHERVRIEVYDGVTEPNPLVIEEQRIDVHVEPAKLRVRETLVINNPSVTCYLGEPTTNDAMGPVSLRLGIPPDFERITFDEEAFGRRFLVVDNRPVTGIPWPPGSRVLAFEYVLPNEEGRRVWRREIDLPCQQLNVRVQGTDAKNVSCNLAQSNVDAEGCVAFDAAGPVMRDHVVELNLTDGQISPFVVARWSAVAVLFLLGGVAGVISLRRHSPSTPDSQGATEKRQR